MTTRTVHQWHLIVTLRDDHNQAPIDVPIVDYDHLCLRIEQMVLSDGIRQIDVYRDGKNYRDITIRPSNPEKRIV